jgi:hypothetical protein
VDCALADLDFSRSLQDPDEAAAVREGLKKIDRLFGDSEAFSKLPVLLPTKTKGEGGGTGYVDYIRVQDMSSPSAIACHAACGIAAWYGVSARIPVECSTLGNAATTPDVG